MKTPPRVSTEAAGIFLIRLAVLALLLMGLAKTWADPDLWGHVRFGGDILRDGLTVVDPYSFTSDVPWVNHEWLAEIIMYGAWATGGSAGLIALKMAIILRNTWSDRTDAAAGPAPCHNPRCCRGCGAPRTLGSRLRRPAAALLDHPVRGAALDPPIGGARAARTLVGAAVSLRVLGQRARWLDRRRRSPAGLECHRDDAARSRPSP